MSYDILLFDADRTLFDFDASEKLAFFEVAPDHGFIPTNENFELYKKINVENWEALEKGLFTKEEIVVRRFSQFFDAIGINGDAKKINEDYLTALSTKSILYDDAIYLVDLLKKANKRIFIITNGVTKVQVGRMERSPLKEFLEEVFISEQMKVSKPQKFFFDLIAQKIKNYDSKRAIVIGDSLTSDIQGANNANLDCIWINLEGKVAPQELKITFEAKNLKEACEFLLKN